MVVVDDESWIDPIFDAVVSEVQASGYFDVVNTHEPKRKPGRPKGITAAVWLQSIQPVSSASGLARTTALLVFIIRAYMNMLYEPQDMIDPKMSKAMSNLIRRYHDDFDFGGVIRNVDVFGAAGVPISVTAGYIEMSNTPLRTMDLVLPCLVNDVWVQAQNG